MTGDLVSLRFLLFALVGGLGLGVHLITLYTALGLKVPFTEAQGLAAFVAMTGNFLLNNRFTYRDQRLKGFRRCAGCSSSIWCAVGLLANVGVAATVFDQEPIWWLAGIAGALMGVVWNYGVSSLFVWRAK
jgi:dolichol-phosphate mannosyltransferase